MKTASSHRGMEFKLWSLVLLLLDQGGLPLPKPGTTGYILDAGANDGKSAEGLARALHRHDAYKNVRVLAVEPLRSNVKAIESRAKRFGGLDVLHAGLGAVDGTIGHYPLEMDNRSGSIMLQINAWTPRLQTGQASYAIRTVDALFSKAQQRTLLLAHLDLEGLEHIVLPAANETIMRDRPIVSVETYPQKIPKQHEATMAFLSAVNYAVFTVEEIVGGYKDGRNRVGIPRERARVLRIANYFFHGGIGKAD